MRVGWSKEPFGGSKSAGNRSMEGRSAVRDAYAKAPPIISPASKIASANPPLRKPRVRRFSECWRSVRRRSRLRRRMGRDDMHPFYQNCPAVIPRCVFPAICGQTEMLFFCCCPHIKPRFEITELDFLHTEPTPPKIPSQQGKCIRIRVFTNLFGANKPDLSHRTQQAI